MKDKTILITGGTGSLGTALTRKLLTTGLKKAVVFSRDELKQFEMGNKFNDSRLRFFVGDIRDKERLYRAFDGVDYIIHAAALKQVPSCEYNPFEAIKTNILGGQNIIEAAIDRGVEKVLAVSTDKAVQPLNLYGATKACMEKLFIQANTYSSPEGAKFSVARYGNVVGSRGSVIPFFKSFPKTGNLPITHPDMTRFWITLEQAVKFVLDCIERMDGGEIFVPKIPSMKIADLAEAICPGKEWDLVGIRPGEKLHEYLVTEDEARRTLDLDCYLIQPEFPWWTERRAAGNLVPEGFSYCSETNDKWLTTKELRDLL